MNYLESQISKKVALCVGINYYEYWDELDKCVEDAMAISQVLAHNEDGSENFDVFERHARDRESAVTRRELKYWVEKLFDQDAETALFYFAGHGISDKYGSYLCTSESREYEDGFSLETLMNIVRASKVKNKVIILDSCHSGEVGLMSALPDCAFLPENTTILSACGKSESAYEGVFTPIVVDALNGGAGNLFGEVTTGELYSYIDRSLSILDQHPVIKVNSGNYVCFRRNKPPIWIEDLKKLTLYFPYEDYEFPLDPSYEEDKFDCVDKTRNLEHEAVFRLLRKYVQLNLVEPVGEEYMYWAAILSKSCRLTSQGKLYWKRFKDE